MLLWAVIGLLIAGGILTVIYILDDSIRTEEDVERYLGLSVIGVVPEHQNLDSVSHAMPVRNRRSVKKTTNKK